MKQIKNIATLDELRALLADVGVELPIAQEIDPDAGLGRSIEIGGGHAPALAAPNRLAILPMEGWDAGSDGMPTDLVRRRWSRFGGSGAGLVWGEASAVRPDGRANPRQLMITNDTAGALAELRASLATDQVAGIQLTHSGRWSNPTGTPAPRTAYRHPVLDTRNDVGDEHVLSDTELDDLGEVYVAAAHIASEAGFDFVDVKACHGYLLHELLTAYDRPGRYGGDLAGRSRLLTSVIGEIRQQLPSLTVAVRLSAFDLLPHEPGADGIGVPSTNGPYRYAFGGDEGGLAPDLDETHQLLDRLAAIGISLVSTTAGSPYYNPHAQRPAFFPPSDGYKPPEDPLVGVARQIHATAEITRRHPDLTIIGSGYTYLQDWIGHVGQAAIEQGWTDMVGLGRMALSYPDLPQTLLKRDELDRRQICRTFSDCTTAPRAGLVSGCYPLDPYYNAREERIELARAKKEARRRLQRG